MKTEIYEELKNVIADFFILHSTEPSMSVEYLESVLFELKYFLRKFKSLENSDIDVFFISNGRKSGERND